jgi:hypothetical protein
MSDSAPAALEALHQPIGANRATIGGVKISCKDGAIHVEISSADGALDYFNAAVNNDPMLIVFPGLAAAERLSPGVLKRARETAVVLGDGYDLVR